MNGGGMMTAQEKFGAMLRSMRTMQRRSASEVAAAIGISRNYLDEIEKGNKQGRGVSFEQLAKGYGVPVERLAAAYAEMKRTEIAAQGEEWKEVTDFAAAVNGTDGEEE
jgi:transcriptional regulator with XRE-family HTH domain